MHSRQIELRGVRVHNLKDVDLEIPHGQFVSVCGLSGSGKSSLAFDTLYAEGQRRYFESLSTYTRQFLDQLDRPDADRISGILPAIAIRSGRHKSIRSGDRQRTTVGTASEILEYLRLMFTRIGKLVCPDCGLHVRNHDPDSISETIQGWMSGTRFQVTFESHLNASTTGPSEAETAKMLAELQAAGFRRIVVGDQTRDIESVAPSELHVDENPPLVVVDRLTTDLQNMSRLRDSLETALVQGQGHCVILQSVAPVEVAPDVRTIDGRHWRPHVFSRDLACSGCRRTFSLPQTQLFHFGNPLGACPQCEGFGSVLNLDMERIVPDPSLSLQDGAIAPWNTPAYQHEKQELLALADDYHVPVDLPFSELSDDVVDLIWRGVVERDFGGLNGFFAWLERKKYKVQIGVFLNRWKTSSVCPTCQGQRLNAEALAYHIGDHNIAQLCDIEMTDLIHFFLNLELTANEQAISQKAQHRLLGRLQYLCNVGLGYLTLARGVSTLSSGESQRVMLTKILGSTLTSMLYVLDEPSSGLHQADILPLIEALKSLNARGNTLVVVDHQEDVILAAQRIIELGPEAGHGGGNIVFDGSPETLLQEPKSTTGQFISLRQGLRDPSAPRRKSRGNMRLDGATGNNLKNLSVAFPLNSLCLVTGVSGAGKSSLIRQTLYPAVCKTLGQSCPPGLPYTQLAGGTQVDEVVLIDQAPIGRTSRSNPVTYVKAFDEIRKTFAETAEAKSRNFKAGHFSFNVDGGRCSQCKGEGQLTIEMQFMSNIYVTCDACRGTRFRDEVLQVRYRARNIYDVLNMTVREAFGFFRGKTKLQTVLKSLIDVGLEYVRLGQAAPSLSSGEAQRLKLAHYLSSSKQQRVLFLMEEPTFGLHMRDVIRLVDCMNALLAAGHSLIVVEHNVQLMKYADWIIDMGPGASKQGGEIVAAGTPEDMAVAPQSVTGKCLQARMEAEQKALLESAPPENNENV